MEKFGIYKYRILQFKADREYIGPKTWYYEIMIDDNTIIRKSKESFYYEGIARFAAIGHISLLEQGKG